MIYVQSIRQQKILFATYNYIPTLFIEMKCNLTSSHNPLIFICYCLDVLTVNTCDSVSSFFILIAESNFCGFFTFTVQSEITYRNSFLTVRMFDLSREFTDCDGIRVDLCRSFGKASVQFQALHQKEYFIPGNNSFLNSSAVGIIINCFKRKFISKEGIYVDLLLLLGARGGLVQRFSNCGPRTTSGPRILPSWSFQIEHQSKKDRKNKINVNCVSHTIVENLKQSLEITYNKCL